MYWCLEGRASEVYATLVARDVNITFHDLNGKFQKTAQIQCLKARQINEETLEEWIDSLLFFATQAFQDSLDTHMMIVLSTCM